MESLGLGALLRPAGKASGAAHKERGTDLAVAALKQPGAGAPKACGADRHVARDAEQESRPVILVEYANRRLYDPDTSTYVTLGDLARDGEGRARLRRLRRQDRRRPDPCGPDPDHRRTGRAGERNLLPIGFLRQLIRFYGDSVRKLVPSYLEFSLDPLTRQLQQYRRRFAHVFGTGGVRGDAGAGA